MRFRHGSNPILEIPGKLPDAALSLLLPSSFVGCWTIRREYLDRIWFWNQSDLERKLEDYKVFYNQYRCHTGLTGPTPVEELRKLDTQRCEEMYLSLQPAIRKGDPPAVAVGVKVLSHKAKLNGYAAPQKHELTGKAGNSVTVIQKLDQVELESKVNLLRDAIKVLRDLEVPGVIDLPEQDSKAPPADPE